MSKKQKSESNGQQQDPVVGSLAKFVVPLRGGHVEPFVVDVRVLEVRHKFGRVDVKVTPIAGSGEAYVSSFNILTGGAE